VAPIQQPTSAEKRSTSATVVWLAMSPDVVGRGGLFWFDREPQPIHFLPFTSENSAEREALWDSCLSWAGLAESSGRPAKAR
jgi:hypothetical protein